MPSVRAGLVVLTFLVACGESAPPPAAPPPPPPPPPPVAAPTPDTFQADYYQACDSPATLDRCRALMSAMSDAATKCGDRPACTERKERAAQVKDRVAQLEKIQALQQDSTQRHVDAVAADAAAARALQERIAKEHAEATWKAAPDRCVHELNDQACADTTMKVSDADRDECRRRCENGTTDWIKDHVDGALKACFVAYEGGDHQATCKVDLPSTTLDSRRSRVTDMLQDCSKTCTKEGGDFVQARRSGAGLVARYKSCMGAVLGTNAAQHLKTSDDKAYNDLFGRTDVRCRPLGRCDWVEKYTDLQCNFTSN